jgi:hypothetical protein
MDHKHNALRSALTGTGSRSTLSGLDVWPSIATDTSCIRYDFGGLMQFECIVLLHGRICE